LDPFLDNPKGESNILSRSALHKRLQSEDPIEGLVVVIDDERTILELMESFLRGYGIKVKGFTSPRVAIEWYRENAANVRMVFLDMCNPIMNGEDCFPILRSIDTDVPIVIISGSADLKLVNQLIEQGALSFIPKPFDFLNLAAWIRQRLPGSVQYAS